VFDEPTNKYEKKKRIQGTNAFGDAQHKRERTNGEMKVSKYGVFFSFFYRIQDDTMMGTVAEADGDLRHGGKYELFVNVISYSTMTLSINGRVIQPERLITVLGSFQVQTFQLRSYCFSDVSVLRS